MTDVRNMRHIMDLTESELRYPDYAQEDLEELLRELEELKDYVGQLSFEKVPELEHIYSRLKELINKHY